MASLANCIKRAGKAISAADADVLKQSRQEYIEAGETAQRATERAIIDMIRTIEAERQDLVEQITAKGGVVGEYAPFVDAVAQPAGKVPDVKSERQDVVPSRQEKDQEPPAPKARPDGYGKGNKVFTADAAEKARELLRKKLNQMRAGFDPEMALAGLTLAGYHIEAGAREFASYVRAMIEDLGDGIRPYLRGYYENVRGTPGFDTKGMSTIAEIDAFEDTEQNANSEGSDAPVSGEGLERDSAAPGDAARNDNGAFFDESGATGQGAGLSGAEAGGQRAQSDSNSGLPRTVPDPDGRGGDPGVPGRDQSSPAAGSGNRGGGNAGGSQRSPAGRAGAGAAKAVAPEARELKQEQRQAEADQIAVKAGDLDNIRATLPVLLPQQQEDVEFAEKRLLVNKGRGVMFTNGTGTGKTFTGLGTIKRYHRMGKRNILIVVPNDKVASDWQKSGTLLGLEIHQLENTKDGGRGVSVTTYANFYQNEALHDTNWDLVVLDESHYLLQKDDFAPTQNLDAMRAIARHPDGLMRRFHAVERDFLSEYEAAKARLKSDRVRAADNDQAIPDAVKSRERVDVLSKQYDQKLRNLQESYKQEWNDHKGADILFLSATPFAYRKSIEYAAGFLFDYGTANENGRSYNRGNAREQFFVANFGYRMKHNKLNDPDKRFIDLDLMERNFSDGLRRAGSVRSRMLEVEFDYDRRFIAVDDLIGHKVDGGRAFIDAKRDEYRKSDPDLADSYWALSQDLEDKFGYLERAFLLESIKAKHSIPYIKKYLAQGKKVVVFHDFNKGGGFHPFRVLAGNPASKAAFDDFKRLRPDLMNLNFDSLLSPRDTLRAAFGDKALFISGLEPKKQKRQSIDKFNSDGGEHNLIIVQADSGREGISLHDTSGKHQRVLLNLGLPNKPIASIQTEGRIYRTFLKSNAIQRYMATGLALENWAIASKLAARSGTAENLAMGSMARGLKESFALALDEAQAWEPGHDGEGTGGKQRDRELVQAPTEFERAKTYYYAQQKISANRDQREGADYFATPEPVGLKMVEWASIQPGDAALEPSAGHGAILRFMPDSATVHFIEQSGSLASKAAIAAPFASFKERNFEDHHIVNKYDAIVMNPPFGAGGGTARDHVAKAITHLKNKGRIVALIPAGPSADKKFEKLLEDSKDIFQVAEIKLPKVTFSNAGTMVGTRILVLQKETNAAEIGDVPESVNIDLSNAENINELFSRIESLAIKGRPAKAEESAMPAQNADALPKTEKPAYSLHKFQHTKTKADVFVAKAEAFLGDAYQSVLAKAKANNGWYNAYGVAPSVKGFAFHSEADRQKFLDAVGGEKDANKEPRAKVSLAPNNPQSLARVKKIVANLQKTLQAVPIEVAESFADLPQAVQDWANERGYADRLQAVYHNGKAYVVADKAGTAREIVKSVLHEVVGHHGIQGVLGERINAVLDQIAASLNGKATLPNGSDIAKAYGLDWNDPAQRREIVEEYLAHLAETGARPGFIRMVAAKIRAMLRKAFPQLKWSDGDILDLLAQSRKYVSRVRSSGAAGTRASVSTLANTIESDNQSRARLINFSPAYDAVANTTIATPQAWQPFWKRVWNTIKNDYLPQSMKEFKQGVFDQFHSIEDLEKEVNGALLDGSESAYKAALRTQNLSSVMEAVMQKGVLEYANGGVRLKTGSKGFMDIFKEIHQADLMREWEVWAAAKRASRLITEGKERNFNQAQIDTVLREVDSKPAVKAMFERAQRDWITFNKGMLDFAESAGLIDPMERAVWEKDDYLPFHRINQLEDEPAKGPGRNKGLSGQKAGIRKLKGGVEKISPLESMVLNTTHLVDAAFRNIAMQRVAELAEQTQVMTPLNQVPGLTPAEIEAQLRELGYDPATMTPTQIRAWTHNIQRHAKKGDGVVTVSENGKLKAYKVEDALLMRAITSMGHHGVEGVMRLFRGAKRLLTNAVTADPAFMLRNFLRDSLSTAVTVDAKITPIADAIRKMSGNEDLRWQLQAAGAGGGGFHDTSPEDVRAHLSKLRKGNKVIRSVKDAWDAWQKIGSRFENANRLAVADKILKDGGTLAEAAHEAQDVLNFTRRGDYRVMQILIEMTPFLNARVQGLERLWRGAMENTPQGLKMRQHFWMRGMIITGLTLALLAANWDDDRYWELPEWDRDTYYHFFVGDEHFRLPKPFEVGAIFSTIPERMFEQMRADADAKLLGERMLHMIQDTFALAQVPQLFKPAYEVATNTNGFTGRPVVSYALQFVQPEAQYDPYTSETMRWIADAMPNVAPDWMRSPKKLEHALRGYVGAIGGYAVDMADFLGRNAFDMPDTPALRGRDWPVVKSFYQTGVGPTKHTDQLYQMAEAANELQSAIKKYKEEGRIEKAKDLESDNMAKLLARTAINRAVRQMSELNGQTRKILNANVPADLKRSRVDALQKQKQKLAADVVEKYRASFR